MLVFVEGTMIKAFEGTMMMIKKEVVKPSDTPENTFSDSFDRGHDV